VICGMLWSIEKVRPEYHLHLRYSVSNFFYETRIQIRCDKDSGLSIDDRSDQIPIMFLIDVVELKKYRSALGNLFFKLRNDFLSDDINRVLGIRAEWRSN